MAPLVCEWPFPICSPDTDLGTYLTLWTDNTSYLTAHHSKCTVFLLLLFACTSHGISFCSAPLLALVTIIWFLVVPFNFVGVYLTFPKVLVCIFRHATSLHLSLLAGPALFQVDLDYQKADIDQIIKEYVGACQGPSAELDEAFIRGIEIGLSILLSAQTIQSLCFQFRVTNVHT